MVPFWTHFAGRAIVPGVGDQLHRKDHQGPLADRVEERRLSRLSVEQPCGWGVRRGGAAFHAVGVGSTETSSGRGLNYGGPGEAVGEKERNYKAAQKGQ